MRFFILFSTLFTTLITFSQGPPTQKIGSIDGQVFDSISRKPIEYASIRVCNDKDTSLVAGIYTDEFGKFVLDQLPTGRFIIKISQAEFKDKFINGIVITPQKPLRKLGSISLSSTSQQIEEVIVQGKKDILQTGIDKKVYNVGEDISVQGGSANDVLNNIPSIEIDQDGKLSLRGDGNVTILIDGRPSSLSGGNGKSALDGISAASIERIEVVTNPSAKYDPDGTSGIINIVLKKNIRRGLNGNVNLSAATGNAYNGSTSLSMRNTKFNLYGNYSYDYRDGYRNNLSDISQVVGIDSNINLQQRRYGRDLSKTHTGKIGMDIYVKDRNTLTWSIAGNGGDRTRLGDQSNFRYFNENTSDTIGFWNRYSDDPGKRVGMDFAAGYNWEFKEEKGGIDWSVNQSLGEENNKGFYFQQNQIPFSTLVQDQQLESREKNNVTTASMDIVRILKNNWRTESGIKLIHRNMGVNTHSSSRDSISNPYENDTLAFFNYEYTERIYSAYGIAARAVNKWKYQLGVRVEKSFQEPKLISKNESYSNDYLNAFPSAFIRYAAKKSLEFSLGYSKRINRPSSENLNPFTSYADPYNLRRGNPALRPEYIHSVDLGVEWTKDKFSVTASLYQRYSFEVIQRVKIFYADGTSAGTFANIDNSQSTGGELVIQFRPKPIWRNVLSINSNYIAYKDASSTSNYNRSGFALGGKISSTLELWKRTLTVQLNANYNAPSVSAQGKIQPRGSVNLSMDKSLSGGKWGIGMRMSDIFNTQGFQFELDQPTVKQTASFKWQTRRLYITVRYKFGRTDFNDKKKSPDGGGGGGGFDF